MCFYELLLHRLQFSVSFLARSRQSRKERLESWEEKVKVGGAGVEGEGGWEGREARQAEGVGKIIGCHLKIQAKCLNISGIHLEHYWWTLDVNLNIFVLSVQTLSGQEHWVLEVTCRIQCILCDYMDGVRFLWSVQDSRHFHYSNIELHGSAVFPEYRSLCALDGHLKTKFKTVLFAIQIIWYHPDPAGLIIKCIVAMQFMYFTLCAQDVGGEKFAKLFMLAPVRVSHAVHKR